MKLSYKSLVPRFNRKKTQFFLQKALSIYIAVTLVFGQLAPFLSIVGQVRASELAQESQSHNDQNFASVFYDIASHSLAVTATDASVESQLAVYFEHDGVITPSFITLVNGKASVYLGSKSGEHSYMAKPSRILLKLQSGDYVKAAQIDVVLAELTSSTDLPFVSYMSSSIDLETSEQLWLQQDTYKIDRVKIGTEYTYPTNSAVSVTFTRLPEETGSLSIKEITLSDEQVEKLGAVSNIAYEITSSMTDGTFEYDLTLPNPSDEAEVSVQYSEDGTDFEVAEGDETVVEEKDSRRVVTIRGLDHFTVFVVVLPEDMATSILDVYADTDSWFFYNDELDLIDNSLGNFVSGPSPVPYGLGSVSISVTGTQRRNLATYQFSGQKLSEVTELGFSTYNPSAGNGGSSNRSAYLNFNVDFDGSDGWQNRLVYVPNVNGTVIQDSWQYWDVIDSGDALWTWSKYVNNGNKWPDGNTSKYRTWDDLISSFPDIAVRTTDSWLGLRVGEPYADGYTEYIDGFVFGTGEGTTIYNFEPAQLTAPTLISPASDSSYRTSDLPVTQKWSSVTGANQYVYQSCKTDPALNGNECPSADVEYTQMLTATNRKIGTTADEGYYWWQVKALSGGGLESGWSTPRTFAVDNSAPEMNNIKMFVNGVETTFVKPGDSVSIQADVVDALSEVDKVQIWVRNYPYTGKQITAGVMSRLSGDTFEFVFTMPTTYSNGDPINQDINGNYFNFRPFDSLGNSKIGWRNNFTFDTTKPGIEIISPDNFSHVADTFEIKVKGTDYSSGIGQFVVNLSNSSGHLASCVNQNGGGLEELVVTCSINTETYPDGEYFIKTNVRDLVGNMSQTLKYTFVFDNTDPEIDYVSPNSTDYYSDTVNVNINITEQNPSEYRFRIRGIVGGTPSGQFYNTGWVTVDDSFSGNFTYDWDSNTGPYGDGLYRLDFEFKDKAGNLLKKNQTVNVDNGNPTAPGTPIPTPASPTNQTTQSWTWTAATDTISGIANYLYGNAPVIGGVTGSVLGWSSTTNTTVSTNLVEGIWKMFVKAVDNAGNEGPEVSSEEYVVDTTAPVVSIDSHTDGDVVSDTIQILGSIIEEHPGLYNLSLYPGHEVATTWTFSNRIWQKQVNGSNVVDHLLDTTQFADGDYMIRLAARDAVGNRDPQSNSGSGDSVQVIKIKINNTGPVISDIAMTVNGVDSTLAKPGDTIRFSATITDDQFDIKRARVIARKGNPLTADTILINQNMQQSGSNPDEYYLEFALPSTYTSGVDLNQEINGNFFRIRAWDEHSVVSLTGQNKFTIDSIIPSSRILGPGNSTDSDPTPIYLSAWDGGIIGDAADLNGSGVAGVEVIIQRSIDNYYWTSLGWQQDYLETTQVFASLSAPAPDTTVIWNYSLPIDQIVDGSYTITSKAFDSAGNKENSARIILILDREIPEVSISVDPTNPDGNNDWYKTRPTVTLNATDKAPGSGIKEIQYQWNGTNDSNWQMYSSPFQIPGEGTYILYYRAIDNANNPTENGMKNLRWDDTDLEAGPLDVKANPSRTSGSTSTITWETAKDNIGIDRYEIIWKLKGTATQYNKSVNSTTFETEIDKMTEEGEWEVFVRAFDSVGNSKDGSTTVVVDRSAPAAPVLTLAGTGAGTADLAWNAVEDASRYIVYYGVNPGDYIFAASVGNVTEFTVQGLAAGTYYFMVRAVDNVDNQSPNSNEVSTGAIGGAAGTVAGGPLIPAEGFEPAGDVLGDDDTAELDENGNSITREGEVAGVSDEQCGAFATNAPWIFLALIAIGATAIEFLLKRQTGLNKLIASAAFLGLAIITYYFLRNSDCFANGSFASMVNSWYWAFAAVLAGLIRLIGYAFVEEVEM